VRRITNLSQALERRRKQGNRNALSRYTVEAIARSLRNREIVAITPVKNRNCEIFRENPGSRFWFGQHDFWTFYSALYCLSRQAGTSR
jgi:hypothetical protein